ncbi:hypothetical protein Mro03_21890 [Microbispora rosea subsp. rosea]|nr:hypothetical protein Mro03_21890 [Microbispora rosea subsp. rosea]
MVGKNRPTIGGLGQDLPRSQRGRSGYRAVEMHFPVGRDRMEEDRNAAIMR